MAGREQEPIYLDGERVILPLKAAVVQDMTVRNVVRAFVIEDFERCDISDPETAARIMRTWRTLYEMSGNQADDMICSDLDLGNGAYRFIIYSATLQDWMYRDFLQPCEKALYTHGCNLPQLLLQNH